MMRLTKDKLDYTLRAQLPRDIKPHKVGNTSIIYLYSDRALVYTIESTKCEWLQEQGIIESYRTAGEATYRGYGGYSYNRKYQTHVHTVYEYTAPLWEQPSGAAKTEVIRIRRKINKVIDSISRVYNQPVAVYDTDVWGALAESDIHPDVSACGNFMSNYFGTVDNGRNDWAILGGELRWIDPMHSRELCGLHLNKS